MALSNAEPLNSLLQELFRKKFKYISTNSGNQVLGLGRYSHNSIKFIYMDNVAQNASSRVCYVKELEFSTAPVPPGLAEGDLPGETEADKSFSCTS